MPKERVAVNYQYIRHSTYTNYVLAQGYCDFQDAINNGGYGDFLGNDMEVVEGFPDPSCLTWRSFDSIKQSILANKSKHYNQCLAEMKTLIPDTAARSQVFKQLQDLKPLFEIQDTEVLEGYLQSCVGFSFVGDPSIDQGIVNLLYKYFDFTYMEALPFEELQSLGNFSG